MTGKRYTTVLLACLLFGGACDPGPGEAEFQPEILPLPADLPEYAPIPTYEPMPIPEENPMSAEKVALGRQLYYDKRLSGDGVLSCYSCHLCEKGLTDGRPKAIGAFEKQLTRSAPPLWNIGYHSEFYWDGRAKSLETQALAAWKGGNMGADPEKVAVRLDSIQGYRDQFQKVFNQEATPKNVSKALAAYMRTIISRDTPWDRWQGGEESAVSEEAKRGWQVFQEVKCDNCHSGVLFTDLQYHNVGIGMDTAEPDPGRFKVTNIEKDTGAFKTPTLRDIGDSAPYMHDGSVGTLEEAVDLMLSGGKPNPYLDRTNLEKAKLTEEEKKDLVAFLRSLDELCTFTEPELPPEQ